VSYGDSGGPLVSDWCGPSGAAPGPLSNGWRPYRRAAVTIGATHGSLYRELAADLPGPGGLSRRQPPWAWLAAARGASGGPEQLRQRRPVERCFSRPEWDAILAVLDDMPTGDRLRSAVSARPASGWRSSTSSRCASVRPRATAWAASGSGARRWLFSVVGKGREGGGDPAVRSELLAALRSYREALACRRCRHRRADTAAAGSAGAAGVSDRRANQVLSACSSSPRSASWERTRTPRRNVSPASAHWFATTALTRQWEKGIPLPPHQGQRPALRASTRPCSTSTRRRRRGTRRSRSTPGAERLPRSSDGGRSRSGSGGRRPPQISDIPAPIGTLFVSAPSSRARCWPLPRTRRAPLGAAPPPGAHAGHGDASAGERGPRR